MEMPQASTSIGKKIHDINVFLFEKNKKVMYVVALILIPALTYFVFNWEAKDKAGEMLGNEDIRNIIAQFSGGGGGGLDFGDTADFEQMRSVVNQDLYVTEGANSDIRITANSEKIIEQLSITITWEDEGDTPNPHVRRYRNTPDTFSATLIWPGKGNYTFIAEEDNGRITGSESFTEEEMEELYGLGDFILRITCIRAGDWEALISPFDFMTLPDTGNDVSVQIEEVYYAPPLSEE